MTPTTLILSAVDQQPQTNEILLDTFCLCRETLKDVNRGEMPEFLPSSEQG
jgi:hypothetical protein